MKTQAENVQRLDDIIFENRNKEYGAYAIRKNYNTNVLKAEAVSIGIGALIFIIPILMRDEIPLPPVPAKDPVIELKEFGKLEPRITPPPPQPPRRINASIIPTRVTTQEVPDEPSPNPVTDEVTFTTGTETGITEAGTENQVEAGIGILPVEIEDKPFIVVEIMPVYEGGDEAMMKFIQKKLHYPSRARSAGKQGTVYVSFVINADGRVSDVEVIKGFFKDCDEEAVRVIAMMDKWKAGIQNSRPVSVKKVLPITFRLN